MNRYQATVMSATMAAIGSAAMITAALVLHAGRSPAPPIILRTGRPGGPASFGVDPNAPAEPVTILFFQGRPTVPFGNGRRLAVAEGGRILISEEHLRLVPVPIGTYGGTVVGAAPAPSKGLWLSLLDGTLVRLDADGRTTKEMTAPYPSSYLWPASTGGVWVSRSPERFSFDPEPASASIAVAVSSDGSLSPRGGAAVVPEHTLLTTLANAGYLVAAGDTVFYAPLSRSEIIAFGPRGDTLWSTAVPGGPATPTPRFQVQAGKVHIEYQPYNLGLTLGPDRKLYRIRAVDTLLAAATLDVIDARTGRLLATAALSIARANLAVNDRGRLYLFSEESVLGAATRSARDAFPAFDLPRRGGGRLSLAEYRGNVTLVNFWASWCGPCRTEMPALDSLERRLSGPGFGFAALNADLDWHDADQFATDHGIAFPIGYGGAGLEGRYHYPGLPFTVLLDADGRVVRRWIGQLSQTDLETIALLVAAERTTSGSPGQGPPAVHHHHLATPTR